MFNESEIIFYDLFLLYKLLLVKQVCPENALQVLKMAALVASTELPENWTDTRETLLEGMVFQLKYLGVTLVEQPKGEELSAAAVKRIVATVRSPWK